MGRANVPSVWKRRALSSEKKWASGKYINEHMTYQISKTALLFLNLPYCLVIIKFWCSFVFLLQVLSRLPPSRHVNKISLALFVVICSIFLLQHHSNSTKEVLRGYPSTRNVLNERQSRHNEPFNSSLRRCIFCSLQRSVESGIDLKMTPLVSKVI